MILTSGMRHLRIFDFCENRLNQEVLVGGYGFLFRTKISESPKSGIAYLIIR